MAKHARRGGGFTQGGLQQKSTTWFSWSHKKDYRSPKHPNEKNVLSVQDANIVLIHFDMTDDDVNACRKLPIATLSLMCGLPNGFVLL